MAVVATLSKGYDLDYIWKQVDRGPAKDAASYYIQASETGGEPPGRWWGPGAGALGFEPGQTVERQPYDLLFGERKSPDGTQLGRPPGNGRKAADLYAALLAAEPHATAERKRELRTEAVRKARQSPLFFDLTISLSKSISIFHASLGENARLARQAGDQQGNAYWSALVAEVDDMIWQAINAGFGYFQREAGYTRTGSHNTRVPVPATAPAAPGTALSVLAAALDRDGQQHSATQTRNQALADADHLALLHAIWAAETTPAREQRYRNLLAAALPGHHTVPGPRDRWLWRTLHGAELAAWTPRKSSPTRSANETSPVPATSWPSSTPASGTGPAPSSRSWPGRGPRASPPSPIPNAAPTSPRSPS